MPSIRIGFSTDFNLVGEQVGIGTTNPTARLEVAGQILADNTAGGGGVSTLTRYDGFLHTAQDIGNTVSIAETTKGNLNSLSGEIKISGEVTVTGDTPITGGRLESLTVTDSFDLPHGGSEYKDDAPEKGTTRFNQDLGQLEFYTGLEWRTVGSIADTGGRGRGIVNGGDTPSKTDSMEYIQIHTLGNALEFGTDTFVSHLRASCASHTRGLWGGGNNGSAYQNSIDYVTIASTGDAIEFGDLTHPKSTYGGGLSSSTRGIWAGGYSNVAPDTGGIKTIDYVEIATTGDALSFGELDADIWNHAGTSSPIRGFFCGGSPVNEGIRKIIIASKGNSVNTGELNAVANSSTASSNSTRAVLFGGQNPTNVNTMEYFDTSSDGNTIISGELTEAKALGASVSSQTRGVLLSGRNPSNVNNIEYINFSTLGNAIDFGDLGLARQKFQGCSDSHGGLGGF